MLLARSGKAPSTLIRAPQVPYTNNIVYTRCARLVAPGCTLAWLWLAQPVPASATRGHAGVRQ